MRELSYHEAREYADPSWIEPYMCKTNAKLKDGIRVRTRTDTRGDGRCYCIIPEGETFRIRVPHGALEIIAPSALAT